MGTMGAMRRDELTKLSVDDIQDNDKILIVTVRDAKMNINRTFTITNPGHISLYRKYAALRPTRLKHRRLFIRYEKGKCTSQVVGVHTIGKIPSLIAKYLHLPHSDEYTGHCFKISANLLADSDASTSTTMYRGR